VTDAPLHARDHTLLHAKDLALPALRERFAGEGWPRWRADQWAAWVYGRGVADYEAMTDLPAELRRALAERWPLPVLERREVQVSADGTRKARLRSADGHEIEAVLIPEEGRLTLCVSTQVGCPLACSFCATGAMGFTRNLRTAEIVDQVCQMQALAGPDAPISNVVFMGMGEPLLNLPAVLESISLLVDPKAFGLAPRRVTVSTAGVVPRIAPLLEAAPVNLAVSLHAASDEIRDVLVPLNRRFDLDALLGALRACERITRRRPVFFEYTLIEGVNDSPEEARRLVARVRGLPCKVNLIPMNAHADSRHGPPPEPVMERFMAELARAGLVVTLRRNRGADIDAACGQLAARRAAPGAR
jgi:23S rRNA (adenine2503-C2)-methyltransferase